MFEIIARISVSQNEDNRTQSPDMILIFIHRGGIVR